MEEYDQKEFDDMVYFYVLEFVDKETAKIEAYFQRANGKYARISKMSNGSWGVYNKEKW